MGQQQSKGELLYQQANYGNSEGIKALFRDGAGLEWIDKEGRTPLIVACMNPGLYDVAKTLIELKANVNAYRPGGTPLHHAAKRGLESTVQLLLSHGANALVMNDNRQTPLEIARAKGYTNVVRAIENHICLFSGWLRQLYGLGFLEVLAPQLLSRNVWVAVLPTGSRSPTKPFKLELAVYPSLQDAQPCMVIALWKANLEEPKFLHSDLSVTIVHNSIPRSRRRRRRCRSQIPRQTRVKLAPAYECDKQQLQAFCNACKGIPQVNSAFVQNPQTHVVQATVSAQAEDLELARAINASIQTAITETSNAASTNWNNSGLGTPAATSPSYTRSSQWEIHEAIPSGHTSQKTQIQNNNMPATLTIIHTSDTIPSGSQVTDEITEDGPIQYPSIDLGPADVSSPPTIEQLPGSTSKVKEGKDATSSCVICLDALLEGACVPCGHMAGCMSCLNEVKAKNWGCPVCRATINQVVRLYAV